jgi:hypothetical protein
MNWLSLSGALGSANRQRARALTKPGSGFHANQVHNSGRNLGLNDCNGEFVLASDRNGVAKPNVRNWLLAGARIGEIIARKLTLKHRIERLVWSRQIEIL